VFLLSQLEQDTGGRLGMHESNPAATGAPSRGLVDQLVTGGPASLERGIQIGDPVTDVVNPGSPFFQESRHRTVRVARNQKLDFGVAEGQGNDGGTVGNFWRVRSEAEDVAIERERGVEIRHRHANVGNTGCLGHHISGHVNQDQRQ
jgi:hypothetical protein